MPIKKSLLAAGIATTIGLAGVGGLGVAHAATTDPSTGVAGSSLIDKLASKFHLSKTEVQAVFDEDRAQHEAEHQQKITELLDQAVTDGKLTATQKEAILAKQAELKTEREANREAMANKTPEEMRSAMKAEMNELQQWASDNDIPTEYLHFVLGGMRVAFGPGGPKGVKEGAMFHTEFHDDVEMPATAAN